MWDVRTTDDVRGRRSGLPDRDRGAPAPAAGGPGYVYAISNPSMPMLLKIGLTAHPVEQRMDHLRSTGVPTPFVKEFAIHVEDARAVETAVHRRLDGCRVSFDREFFRCSPDTARRSILAAADGLVTNAEIMLQFTTHWEDVLERHEDRHRREIAIWRRRARLWKRGGLMLALASAALTLANFLALEL